MRKPPNGVYTSGKKAAGSGGASAGSPVASTVGDDDSASFELEGSMGGYSDDDDAGF